LFANKPGFGTSSNAGTTSLFGGGSSNTGFGNTAAGGFGASNNPGLGNVGEAPGTNITQFQAHVEKEPNSSNNQSNSFQNILFQDAYKKWSAEELRLADYSQGRRHGNATGGGAFGVGSNFGSGFGTSNQTASTFGNNTPSTGLFNTSNTANSSFGQTNPNTFGGSGTLFGNQNKTASGGGLFGSTTQPAAQAGGLFSSNSGTFGNATATNSAFGANSTTGTGLFGSASNTANKPGGFSFGTSSTSTPAFGNTNTTSFGNAATNITGTSLFGNTNQSSGTGLFGNNAQQTTGSAFGSGFGTQNQQAGSSLFNNAQKPTGNLFGSNPSTSGGLFSNSNTASTPFGATNTSGSTGLFGAKPNSSGTGLFGGNAAQTTGGASSLFGGIGATAQTQQPGQGSLFGSMGQNQQKPSIFTTPSQQQSGGIFGNQTNQTQNSIFTTSNPQQQPQTSLGASILGNSQGMNQTPQSLTTSINDISAYGTPSLFSNLGGTEAANPGPLATPLSNKGKPRRSSILPMYKLNPSSATRFVTPQKRGFGFSYSTYGTPASPSSVSSTPGTLNRSLLGSSLGRGLSKSVSTSSLRRNFNTDDSILAPGAFSASSGSRYYGGNGSLKKLVINKDMRSDLFSTPNKDKQTTEQLNGSRKLNKRVSFDTSTVEALNGNQADHSPPASTSSPNRQDLVRSSSNRAANSSSGAKTNTTSSVVEPEQIKGNELAIVHEEGSSSHISDVTTDILADKAPGEYWMRPSREEIMDMNRIQRQKVADFTVGRDNVGQVSFKVPVDLSNIDLDDLYGSIVDLQTRAATVYPVAAKKPPVGKGLNVPARISLEQSWPRGPNRRIASDPKRLNKHVERLKRIENTTFESYDKYTGIWTFSVEHFTTYGLDYDDDTDVDLPSEHHAPMEELDVQPFHVTRQSPASPTSNPDDTFDFRKKRPALPGAFDHSQDDIEGDIRYGEQNLSFLGYSSVGSTANHLTLLPEEISNGGEDGGYDLSEDENEKTASFSSRQHFTTEQDFGLPQDGVEETHKETPGGILRARMRAIKDSASPFKVQVAGGNDWMDMLAKTVSPQKRERVLLRDRNESPSYPTEENYSYGPDQPRRNRVASDGRGFSTGIDLMNSLFDKPKKSSRPTMNSSSEKDFPKVRSPICRSSYIYFDINPRSTPLGVFMMVATLNSTGFFRD
jgi:nuclear pore complex protein Nup98-Nup96